MTAINTSNEANPNLPPVWGGDMHPLCEGMKK